MALTRRVAIWAVAAVILALALLAPAGALAQEPPPRDWNVNVSSDAGTGGCTAAECTLREAIVAARPVDTVRVPADLYVLTQGDLSLMGDRIVGAGARSTIIDGNGQRRVFTVTSVGATVLTTNVSGVTIRNGNGTSTSPTGGSGIGGGVNLQSGNLALNNSQVIGNATAGAVSGLGGGIAVSGPGVLTMIGTTVARNTVEGRSPQGAGIGVSGEQATIGLINSTVADNSGASAGGGIFGGMQPRLLIGNSTIAGNSATAGGGIATQNGLHPQLGSILINTLIVGNTGGACLGSLTTASTHDNLVQDSTCGLTGAGDIQGINPPLGLLGNNGGATDTRALLAGSPAIDAGSGCQTTDQRGVARPTAACDIGAFEYIAPTLTVATSVINDSGGAATTLTYRVTRNGADVAGSPASAGTTHTLEPGVFNVSSSLTGYTVTLGGDCSAAGDVTLGENQNKTCTVVANDNAVLAQNQLPPPVLHERVNMIPARGTIKVKRPGARRFTKLADNGAQLPVGTTVDALKGRVTIVAASDDAGGTDTAVFYGGVFKIAQTKGNKPITILRLTERLSCPKAGNASIAAKRKKKRRLWGDGEGRFRTKGKHSAATVVGTKWLVEDRCKSTLTRVVRGRVSVRDFVKRKTVIVRAGKRYTARAG
jgi:hypothetical protein